MTCYITYIFIKCICLDSNPSPTIYYFTLKPLHYIPIYNMCSPIYCLFQNSWHKQNFQKKTAWDRKYYSSLILAPNVMKSVRTSWRNMVDFIDWEPSSEIMNFRNSHFAVTLLNDCSLSCSWQMLHSFLNCSSAMAKGKPVPHEVQWIIVWLSGMLSKENISYGTGVSIQTVERILCEFREHGTVQEAKEHKGQRQLLGCDEAVVCLRQTFEQYTDKPDDQVLFGTIKQLPDVYLDKLQEMLTILCSVQVSKAMVWHTLRSGGFTLKKVHSCLIYISFTQMNLFFSFQRWLLNIQQKNNSSTWVGSVPIIQSNLFSLTGALLIVKWHTEGTHGPFEAPKPNERLSLSKGNGKYGLLLCISSWAYPFAQSFSVLLALSLDGVLHCEIMEGSFCSATFQYFISGLLDFMQPYPSPNSVIVMDNCHIHKHLDITEMIESWYVIINLSQHALRRRVRIGIMVIWSERNGRRRDNDQLPI